MKQHNKRNRGFTLMELLITVGIVAVLATVTVPFVKNYVNGLRQKELNSKAEVIYSAVQNELSRLKMTGQDHLYQPNDGVYPMESAPSDDIDSKGESFYDPDHDGRFDDPENRQLYYVKSPAEGEELEGVPANLMNSKVVDDELLSNHWVIEYDPARAVVYAVFYSEGETEINELYDSNFSSVENFRGDGYTGVGYYGGASGLDTAISHIIKLRVDVINGEKLYLDVRAVRPAKVEQDPIIKMTLSDTMGHSFSECFSVKLENTIEWEDSEGGKTRYKNTTIERSGDNNRAYEFKVPLDSLTEGGRFTELYGPESKEKGAVGAVGIMGTTKPEEQILIPGTDLHISFEAYCPQNLLVSRETQERDTNSLFAYSEGVTKNENNAVMLLAAEENAGETVRIEWGRHLQNLDESSGVDASVTKAEITSDIHLEPEYIGEKEEDQGFVEVYGSAYFNGVENGRPKFKPIVNDALTSLTGLPRSVNGREVAPVISGLYANADQAGKDSNEHVNAGLFNEVDFARSANRTSFEISDITLTGETVLTTVSAGSAANNGNAGGLIGRVAGNGTLTISGVQTYLTVPDVAAKKANIKDDTYKYYSVQGTRAGGLVGSISGGTEVDIETSSASVLVGNKSTTQKAGGLVGDVNGGSVNVSSSYADCYVYAYKSGAVAGLIGDCSGTNTITLLNTYAAGYVYTANSYYASAGLVHGTVNSAKNVYSLVSPDTGGSLSYGTFSGVSNKTNIQNVFYKNGNNNKNNNTSKLPSTSEELLSALGKAFSLNTASSMPYNLYDQGLTNYTYPVVMRDGSGVLSHYGDWHAGFEQGTLVYYEKYRDANGNISFGFDGANVEPTLQDSTAYTVIGDGYGLVYTKKFAESFNWSILGSDLIASKGSAFVSAKKTNSEPNGVIDLDLSNANNTVFEIRFSEYKEYDPADDANEKAYYTVKDDSDEYAIFPIHELTRSSERSTFPIGGESFYYQAAVRESVSGLVVTADQTRYYYYNPDYAKTVIVLEGNDQADMPEISTDTWFYIRTPRQFYAMSRHYDIYQPLLTLEKGNVTFAQERDIDYYQYQWGIFSTYDSAPSYQTPIGNSEEKAFTGIYDGGSYRIRNISISSSPADAQHYVGLFGYNKGKLRNIVLDADYDAENPYRVQNLSPVNIGNTVYMGILAGYNLGEINNCACAGYVMQGEQGTIVAPQNSYIYLGCLVGCNGELKNDRGQVVQSGTIRNCSVASPELRISSFATSNIGGFVGWNSPSGVIDNCYDIAYLNIVQGGEKVTAGGFAGRNDGRISNSYCATAIDAPKGTAGHGFVQQGGAVNNCSYLNGGTFTYVGELHSYNIAASSRSSGSPLTYSALTALRSSDTHADAAHTFSHANTRIFEEGDEEAAEFDGYPYPAYVRDASGVPVHYGDWQDTLSMGVMGLFYWEHEEGASVNAGYHFSYVGLDITKDNTTDVMKTKVSQGSSLCKAHDDGNVITEYGYGVYFRDTGEDVALHWDEDVFESSLTSLSGAISPDAYNIAASAALESQMVSSGDSEVSFVFYALNTRELDQLKLVNGKMVLSGTKGNMSVATEAVPATNYLCVKKESPSLQGDVTLGYMGEEFSFTLCPFFADTFSYKPNGTEKKDYSNLSKWKAALGTAASPYGIRSYEQLKFINWNSDLGVTDFNFREADIQATWEERNETETLFSNLKHYPCLENGALHWKQSHDLESNDASLSFAGRRSFVPIGQLGEPFMGTYNGGSYRIKNLYIKSSAQAVGLFGRVESGSVQNVILIADAGKGRIECNYKSEYAATLGALIGMAKNSGTISNCASSGYQVVYSGNKNDGSDRNNNKFYTNYGWQYNSPIIIGGLVGAAYGSNIENSSAANDLSATGDISYVRTEIGGLVGTIGSLYGEGASVNNCYTGGTIATCRSERALYGGIVGNARGVDVDTVDDWISSAFQSRNVNWPWYLWGPNARSISISNCYTYCDVPASQGEVRFADLSAITEIYSLVDSILRLTRQRFYQDGELGVLGTLVKWLISGRSDMNQANLAGMRFFIAGNAGDYDPNDRRTTTINISNCYFLRRSSDIADAYHNNGIFNNSFGIEGVSLGELTVSEEADTVLTKLGGDWHAVSRVVGDVTIPGAYTYPVNPGLIGIDYPFPCIVKQGGIYVHYGDWVSDDPYWISSMNTLDIFADREIDPEEPEALLTKTYFLFDEKGKLAEQFGTLNTSNFTYEPNDDRAFEITEVKPGELEGRQGYEVTITVWKTGITVVHPDGFDTSRLSVDVTADLRALLAAYPEEAVPGEENPMIFASSLDLELVGEESGDEPEESFALRATDLYGFDADGNGKDYTPYVQWRLSSEDSVDNVNPYALLTLGDDNSSATVKGFGGSTHYFLEAVARYNNTDYSASAHLQVNTDVPSTVGISDYINDMEESESYSEFVRMRLSHGATKRDEEGNPIEPQTLFEGEKGYPEKLGVPHLVTEEEEKVPELFLFFRQGNIALDELILESAALSGKYGDEDGNFHIYTDEDSFITSTEGELPLALHLDREHARTDENGYYTDLPLYLSVIEGSGIDAEKLKELELTLSFKQDVDGESKNCTYTLKAYPTVQSSMESCAVSLCPYDETRFEKTLQGEGNEGNSKYQPQGQLIEGFTGMSMAYTLPEQPEDYKSDYYDFAGWEVIGESEEPTEPATVYEPGESVVITENTRIVAHWEPKRFVATFDLNEKPDAAGAKLTRDLNLSGMTGIEKQETGVYRVPILDDGLYSTEHFRLEFGGLSVQEWNGYELCMWQRDSDSASERFPAQSVLRDVTYELDEAHSNSPVFRAVWQGKLTLNTEADADHRPETRTYFVIYGDPIVDEGAKNFRIYEGSADPTAPDHKQFTFANGDLSTPHKRATGWYAKVYDAEGKESAQWTLFNMAAGSDRANVTHASGGNWKGSFTPGREAYTIMSDKRWVEPDGDFTIYLKFDRAYQVRLFVNGGTNSASTYKNYNAEGDFYWDSFRQNSNYNSPPAAEYLSRGEDAFAGWYLDAALTTALTAANRPTADFSQSDPVNVDFYAKWKYVVKFDPNGGSFAESGEQVVEWVTEITDPAQTHDFPTVNGFAPNTNAFIGWTTEKDELETLVSDTQAIADCSKTYYAYFNALPTVTYDAGSGGKVVGTELQTKIVAYDPALSYTDSDLPTAAKEQSDFIGWFDKPDGEEGAVQKIAADLPKEGELIWYAHYKPWPVITLQTEGGTLTAAGWTKAVDGSYKKCVDPEATTALPTTVSRDGFDFFGWYTASTGGTQVTSVKISEDTTYYAHYEGWPVVTLRLVGGTLAAEFVPEGFVADGGNYKWVGPRGSEITLPDVKNVLKANLDCVGWKLNQEDTLYSGSKYTVTADSDFTAEYKPFLLVKLDAGEGAINPDEVSISRYDETGIALEYYVPTRLYYDFDYWTLNGEEVESPYIPDVSVWESGEVTLTAKYTKQPVAYLLHYVNDPADFTVSDSNWTKLDAVENRRVYYRYFGRNADGSYPAITLPGATRGLDRFDGWYDDNLNEPGYGGEGAQYRDVTDKNGNIRNNGVFRFTAKFSTHYPVTFDAGDGKFSNGESSYVLDEKYAGDSVTAGEFPADPTPNAEHTSFLGWYTAASGGEKVTSLSGLSEAVTLYAHYIPHYKVELHVNGGSISGDTLLYYDPVAAEPLTLPVATKDKYDFDWWAVETVDGDEAGSPYTPAGDVDLYAKYTAQPQVKLIPKTGENMFEKLTGKTEGWNPGTNMFYRYIPRNNEGKYPTFEFPGAERNPDHFKSWMKDEAFFDAGSLYRETISPETVIEFMAHFNLYAPITLDPNGKGSFAETTTVDAWLNEALSEEEISAFPVPTANEGYKFIGWYDQAEGGNKLKDGFTATELNTKVYAHYVKTWKITFDFAPGATFIGNYRYLFNGTEYTPDENGQIVIEVVDANATEYTEGQKYDLPAVSSSTLKLKHHKSDYKWYIDNTAVTGGTTNLSTTKNVTYHVNWTVNKVKVTFVDASNQIFDTRTTGTVFKNTYYYNYRAYEETREVNEDLSILPDLPSVKGIAGWEFLGWYQIGGNGNFGKTDWEQYPNIAANGSVTTIVNGVPMDGFSEDVGEMRVYAMFKKALFTSVSKVSTGHTYIIADDPSDDISDDSTRFAYNNGSSLASATGGKFDSLSSLFTATVNKSTTYNRSDDYKFSSNIYDSTGARITNDPDFCDIIGATSSSVSLDSFLWTTEEGDKGSLLRNGNGGYLGDSNNSPVVSSDPGTVWVYDQVTYTGGAGCTTDYNALYCPVSKNKIHYSNGGFKLEQWSSSTSTVYLYELRNVYFYDYTNK